MALTLMAGAAQADPADDIRTVAALDTAYQAAVERNDADAMATILHEDMILVLGNGAVHSREDLLSWARTQRIVYQRQVEDEGTQTVRLYGENTAVVTARLYVRGVRAGGEPIELRLWFTDTYVRTAGRVALCVRPSIDTAAGHTVSSAQMALQHDIGGDFGNAGYRRDRRARGLDGGHRIGGDPDDQVHRAGHRMGQFHGWHLLQPRHDLAAMISWRQANGEIGRFRRDAVDNGEAGDRARGLEPRQPVLSRRPGQAKIAGQRDDRPACVAPQKAQQQSVLVVHRTFPGGTMQASLVALLDEIRQGPSARSAAIGAL